MSNILPEEKHRIKAKTNQTSFRGFFSDSNFYSKDIQPQYIYSCQLCLARQFPWLSLGALMLVFLHFS